MGSGTSRHVPVLKCPKGYDSEKFQEICVLFDKLDKDSNLGVSCRELDDIAELHVRNCCTRLSKRVDTAKASTVQTMEELRREKDVELERLKRTFDQRAIMEQKMLDNNLEKLRSKIHWYRSLDEDGRSEEFMKVVTAEDSENIDFWTFFEYMKTRTDDITNIEHEDE